MKYLIAILLLASTALAQNNSGTLVIAPIRPQASNDTFPSAIANEIQGGPFSVATVAAMSNIPAARLVPGALAYVTNDSTFRVLDNTTNWSENFRVRRLIVNADSDAAAFRFGTNITGFWSGPDLDTIQLRAGGSNVYIANTSRIEYTLPALYSAGMRNIGDFTNTSGTIYGLKTNVGPFEGVANFLASNNTTLSNETLFRVGLAEETNRSAQFGFRVARTNNGGEGFAVFSVYGYNALMMIGPSDRSRTNFATNTNAAIEADIWTTSTTNRVATLRDTNSGAFTLHQELGFSTNNLNTNAPATNNTVALWIRVWIGTNSYRLPLYQ